MKRPAFKFNGGVMVAVAAMVLAFGANAQAANIGAGYTQDFNSMGTTTTLPTDWTIWKIGTSHSAWTTAITANGATDSVQAMTQITTNPVISALYDSGITSATKNASAYNIAQNGTTNRVLSTVPTGIDGNAIQLLLTNNTGGALSSINLSYDIVKFYNGNLQSSLDGSLPNAEELPGYQLFYKVGNVNTWYNVAALNPVRTADGIHPVIPADTANATGVNGPVDYSITHIVNANITLAQAVAAGSTLTFRWVDDNAVNISPDQVIGLDNVNATPTPIPAAAWLLGSGLMGLAGFRRKQK